MSVKDFAGSIGLGAGVTGFINDTLPVALFAFLRHGESFRDAVEAVVRCGGDTDTVAAIAGGILGARLGVEGIPESWRAGYADRPRSLAYMQAIALAGDHGVSTYGVAGFIAMVSIRNVLFLPLVLIHGFRRLLPPY